MIDLIYKQEAIDILEKALKRLKELPPAEPTIYGYPVEHLAKIAAVMAAEHISPKEAISIFRDADVLVNVVISEQQKCMENWFSELLQPDKGVSQ